MLKEEQKAALDAVLEELGNIEASYATSNYLQRNELRSRWFRATGALDRALFK